MIRVIRIEGQITSGVVEFAVWDTVKDRFLTIGGDQTWISLDELTEGFSSESADVRERLEERVTSLMRSAGCPSTKPYNPEAEREECVYARGSRCRGDDRCQFPVRCGGSR